MSVQLLLKISGVLSTTRSSYSSTSYYDDDDVIGLRDPTAVPDAPGFTMQSTSVLASSSTSNRARASRIPRALPPSPRSYSRVCSSSPVTRSPRNTQYKMPRQRPATHTSISSTSITISQKCHIARRCSPLPSWRPRGCLCEHMLRFDIYAADVLPSIDNTQ